MLKIRAILALMLIFAILGVPLSGALAQPENPDTLALVSGNNVFAFRLYQAVGAEAEPDANILIAPYSVSQAFAMAYAGAAGDTANQMAGVLDFMLPPETLHPAFSALNADLIQRGNDLGEFMQDLPQPSLSVANAFWGEQTFPFLPTYISQMQQTYGAGLQLTDFANKTEEARQQINQWVADNTNDRIKDIIPEGLLTPNTKLALANAIYFKSFWLQQFDPSLTLSEPFTLLDGSTVTVPMMHNRLSNGYMKGDGYQAVQIYYVDYSYNMTIIMPTEGTFADFEASLDADKLTEIMNSGQDAFVELGMPKFEFEYSASLTQTMQTMGMTDAFNEGKANFSAMAEVTPENNLWISDVLHKTYIGVDEYGTEAAGATVILGLGGGGPPDTVTLTINHPFIFLIMDRNTNSILFVGRVLNPTAK